MNAWLIHHYQNHVVRFSRERKKRCVLASIKMFMSARIHALVIDARAIRVHTIKTRNQKPASKRNEKQTDRSIHAYELKVLRERIHRGTFIKRTILCLFTSIYQQRKSIWLTYDGWVASHSVLSDWHLVISGDFFLFGNRNAKYHKT